jgi:predicted acylesterase/phospholipase RssA
MRSLLETDRRPSLSEPIPPQRASRRMRWIAGTSAGALLAAALSYLIVDQVQTRDQFGHAQMSLGVTGQETHTVSVELGEVRRDLSLLKTQVGSQSTALSQDASQLLGLQTSLAAAQTHVTQQASLIGSLHTCLGGVEQALNAFAVGNVAAAIGALNTVAASCTLAEASSG